MHSHPNIDHPSTHITLIEGPAGSARRDWMVRKYSIASAHVRSYLLNCNFDTGGPWAGVDELFSTLLPEMIRLRPDLVDRYSRELIYVLPSLMRTLTMPHPDRADLAASDEKPYDDTADQATQVVHELIDLLDEWRNQIKLKAICLLCEDYDKAGAMGKCFFQELMRRKPHGFRLVAAIGAGKAAEVASVFPSSLSIGAMKIALPQIAKEE